MRCMDAWMMGMSLIALSFHINAGLISNTTQLSCHHHVTIVCLSFLFSATYDHLKADTVLTLFVIADLASSFTALSRSP